jgi:histidinol dehydrogenase
MIDIRTFSPSDPRFLAIAGRGNDLDADIGPTVAAIIADIRKNGGAALLEYIRQFDAPLPSLESIRVRRGEIADAASGVSPAFMEAIRLAAGNIKRFHEKQLRTGYVIEDPDGVSLAKRVLPIACVGVYCPAGTAPLFSSLLMNVIPAQIAGVGRIAVAIPPRKDGTLCPFMLATADLLGLDEIYKMGGAQAIAALAYGAEPVERVDKIVGPGNAYVATAKRQVYGMVGVDSDRKSVV